MGINKNFVVRNGLEVGNTLLFANDETNRIGINSGTPEFTLDVLGDTSIDGALFSPVSSGGTSGVSGQYLQSTGDKWKWESFPRNRQAERITLTAGQVRVPAVGSFAEFILTETELTSIFIDGVKLTEGDYVINAGGGSITLFAAAFGGEEIEVIAHGAASIGAGSTGILGVSIRKAGIDSGTPGRINIIDFVGLGVTLDAQSGLVTAYIDSGGLTDVLSDPSPQLGGYLDLNNRGIAGVGVITATSFIGDGSNLTGITTLIQAGSNINVSTFNGITTITSTASGGGSAGLFGTVTGGASVGIFTDSAAVGLGTTNPRFQTEIGHVGAAGTQLWVNGDARITGILTVGSSSIAIDGINDEIRIGTSLTITSDGGAQYAGIVTATGFDGDLVGQHKVFTAGVSNSDDYDLAIFLDPTQGGHTFNRFDLGHKLQYNPSTGQLSNLGVTSTRGVLVTAASTFTSEVTFQNNIQLGNNDQAIFGSGNDLRIYFDGLNSYIQDQGTGGINIDANPSVTIGQYGTTAEMASFRVGAGVSLFHNNSKKFETTSVGATITGDLYASRLYGLLTGDVTGNVVGNVTGNATGLSGSPDIVVNNVRVGGALTVAGITSSASFYGSGIGLTGMVDVADGTYGGSTVTPQIVVADGRITGITATLISGGGGGGGGTEVIVEDNDVVVGTAGTINFGSGISVSSSTAGVVTVTAPSAEVIIDTTPQLGGNLDLNNRTINGTGNININGSSRFNGPTTCTSDLDVDGTTTFNGRIIGSATNNVLPFLYATIGDLPSATTYHGAFAHVHATGRAYYAHAANWYELVNKELDGTIGVGTENVNVGIITASSFSGDGSNLTNLPVAGIGTNGSVNTTGIITASKIVAGSSCVPDADLGAHLGANTARWTAAWIDNIGIGTGSGALISSHIGDLSIRCNEPTGIVSVSTDINVAGVVTATSFSGSGNDIVTSRWILGSNGSSWYTFTGPGGLSNSAQPKIYLARGQTYEFVNNSGGSHPFQIQDGGGSAYNTGVTNNNASSGTIKFEVPFSAPNSLQYVCTSHGGMGNTIIIYPDLSP